MCSVGPYISLCNETSIQLSSAVESSSEATGLQTALTHKAAATVITDLELCWRAATHRALRACVRVCVCVCGEGTQIVCVIAVVLLTACSGTTEENKRQRMW